MAEVHPQIVRKNRNSYPLLRRQRLDLGDEHLLHGRVHGMTEEMTVSHTLRRLTLIAQQFGDADHHLERFAALDR
jgi:hypothetical protein